jgi:hypothetical protein
MLGRGHGVKEAATQADVIKLFPATAFSVWQDALYMIIDGVDECDTSQRSIVFKGLSKLINSSAGIVKLVVASRNTVARPLTTSSTRILDINILYARNSFKKTLVHSSTRPSRLG